MTSDTVHDDPHDLDRFLRAQDGGVYEQALAELGRGRKRSHWMWFVFPQFDGLGTSPTSRRYAIGSRAEAKAYLAHPVLGSRLRACAQAMLMHRGRSAREILGSPDDLKLASCATLFEAVAPDVEVFGDLLEQFFGGRRDAATLRLLSARAG